jgi:hypothetical protein
VKAVANAQRKLTVLEFSDPHRRHMMARWEALQAHAAASQEREAGKDGQRDWDDFFEQRGGASSGSFDDEKASLTKHIEHVCCYATHHDSAWHCSFLKISEQQGISAALKTGLERRTGFRPYWSRY